MQLQVDQWIHVTKADMLNMLAIFGDDSPTNHGLVRSLWAGYDLSKVWEA